jgi:hypothetical protein
LVHPLLDGAEGVLDGLTAPASAVLTVRPLPEGGPVSLYFCTGIMQKALQ